MSYLVISFPSTTLKTKYHFPEIGFNHYDQIFIQVSLLTHLSKNASARFIGKEQKSDMELIKGVVLQNLLYRIFKMLALLKIKPLEKEKGEKNPRIYIVFGGGGGTLGDCIFSFFKM